jgi:hypothetical protein
MGSQLSASSDVNPPKGMEKSKHVQQPQNHGNHYHAVQDRLDRGLHGNKTVHQPQKDTHHNENFQEFELKA